MSLHTFSPTIFSRPISRRQMLRGFGALGASSVLSGCGASLYRTLTPAASTQPASSQPSTTTPPATPPTPPAPTPAPPVAPAPQPPPAPVLNEQPLPIGAITAASMTVGSSTTGSFGEGFVGLAYEKQALSTPLFTAANSDLIGLFQRLGSQGIGPGVLRLGCNSVDQNVWTPNGAGQTPGQIAPSDVDALAAFLDQTGWTCIYGVNLGGSATGATTPALAAAEAAYVAQQMGSSLIGIELGNECETYGNPGSFYQYDWTVEMFESLWKQYRDAIVAAVPGAPLTGPAAAGNVDGWTVPFGEYVTNDQINLLTQLYTRGPASTATVDDLILPDTALATELQQLREGAQSMDVPFRIAGCNSYSGGGVAGVSNAYASSLWAIDMIFNCALGGAAGVNFESGNQAGYSLIASPIADMAGTVTGARPIFYGLLMAAMAGPGSLLAAQISADSLNVTGYAVQGSGGSMSLLVVNKDAAQNLDLSIVLPQNMTSATLQAMTQLSTGATTPSLSALSGVTIQGATVGVDGNFDPGPAYDLAIAGNQLSCYVPALSAVLIQLS